MDADSESNPMTTSQADKTKRVNSARTKSPKLDRPIAEIISENFPAFDADTLIVRPFEEEAARDAKFEEGMPASPFSMLRTWACIGEYHNPVHIFIFLTGDRLLVH